MRGVGEEMALQSCQYESHIGYLKDGEFQRSSYQLEFNEEEGGGYPTEHERYGGIQ